jgi:hypothetical protein
VSPLSEGKPEGKETIMLKQAMAAGVLALLAAGPAAAQSAMTANQPISASPGTTTVVEACEAQMRRLAGLNKTLGANYNAEHVHDDCVARTGTGTDFASK